MARKPMVTRTIVTTQATVMCLDTEKGTVANEVITLPRTYADEKKLLKAVQETLAETVKAVHVIEQNTVETLYGMSEQEFIEHATELDPATRKLNLDPAPSNEN